MDSWKIFAETSLTERKCFYSELYLEHITDDHYHYLYVQSNTLLFPDVFENFRNKCIEIYELDSAPFLSASGLAWLACLK